MRIAIHHTSEVGVRAGRILLGERSLTTLGVVDRDPNSSDPRTTQARELVGYDVVVTDAAEPDEIIERAIDAGISCVLWRDGAAQAETYGAAFADVSRTLLVGSNLATGLAPSLAVHELVGRDEVLEVTIGWTEPGRPLRSGEPLAFPDPVGGMWATERPKRSGFRSFVAPSASDWAGAVARATMATGSGIVTRIVGVADLAAHLEGLALAAGAITIGSYASGSHQPPAAADRYLDAMIEAGLGIATHTLSTP